MLTLATLLLLSLPPRALPPAALPPAAPAVRPVPTVVPVGKPQTVEIDGKPVTVHVEAEKIPGVTIGSAKVESIPASVPATAAPRWVAPVAPTYPMQPARRMYYQPPMRSCVNGRCTVTPGYWYYP